jgi:hypothetical protein
VGCLLTTTGPQPDPPTDTWYDEDAASASAGCGCGGSEETERWRPLLRGTISIGTTAADRVTFIGLPGSASPDIVRVTGRSLASADPPSTVELTGDGAFQITLAGQITDEYRLVAEFEGSHSSPVDLVGPGETLPRCQGRAPEGCGGYVDRESCLVDTHCAWRDEACGAVVAWTGSVLCETLDREDECVSHPGCIWASEAASRTERLLPGCLDLEPRMWISFGERSLGSRSTISIEVTSSCDETVSFRLGFREGSTAFSLEGAEPGEVLTLENGELADVAVVFEPGDERSYEDLIFVELIAPEEERWPISLWGDGVP